MDSRLLLESAALLLSLWRLTLRTFIDDVLCLAFAFLWRLISFGMTLGLSSGPLLSSRLGW
jgi:hypothetical protein